MGLLEGVPDRRLGSVPPLVLCALPTFDFRIFIIGVARAPPVCVCICRACLQVCIIWACSVSWLPLACIELLVAASVPRVSGSRAQSNTYVCAWCGPSACVSPTQQGCVFAAHRCACVCCARLRNRVRSWLSRRMCELCVFGRVCLAHSEESLSRAARCAVQ